MKRSVKSIKRGEEEEDEGEGEGIPREARSFRDANRGAPRSLLIP